MIPISKAVRLVSPEAIKDDGSYTSQAGDTKGFDYAWVTVFFGATDIAATACSLTECDTSGGSYTAITAANFNGQTDIAGDTATLPSATDDNKFFRFLVDLRYRKRFLKITLTIDDGTAGAFACVYMDLFRADAVPKTAALMGCDQVIAV